MITEQNCPFKQTFLSDFVKLGFKLFFLSWSCHQAEKDAFKEKVIRCTAWKLLNP